MLSSIISIPLIVHKETSHLPSADTDTITQPQQRKTIELIPGTSDQLVVKSTEVIFGDLPGKSSTLLGENKTASHQDSIF